MDVEHTKALAEDVTEGPWEVETIPETGESRVLRRFEFFGEQIEIVAPGGMQREDAMFIADARSAVPVLVAAVERVQAIAAEWATQPTDYDEDTEQQIEDGKQILAILEALETT